MKTSNLPISFGPFNNLGNTTTSSVSIDEVRQLRESVQVLNAYLPGHTPREIQYAITTYGHSNVFLHATRYGRLPF